MKQEGYQKIRRLLGDIGKSRVPGYRATVRDGSALKLVRSAKANGSLTLVLGAGASMGAKLPDWNDLVTSLADEVFADRFKLDVGKADAWKKLPNEAKVRLLESMAELKAAFRGALHRELYKHYASNTVGPAIAAVGKFISKNVGKRKTLNVITYNFDDLLERHLRKTYPSLKVCSIYSKETFSQKGASVRVYHPHGFIPFSGSSQPVSEGFLVFSEPEYHTQYFDLTHWSNLIQLQCFLQTTCLFIGFSFEDKNVRRLMDQANRADRQDAGAVDAIEMQHVAVRKRKLKDSKTSAELARLTNFLIEADYKSFGIRPYWVDDYDSEIPKLLSSI